MSAVARHLSFTLSLISPVHVFSYYSFKIPFSIILPSTHRFSKRSLSFVRQIHRPVRHMFYINQQVLHTTPPPTPAIKLHDSKSVSLDGGLSVCLSAVLPTVCVQSVRLSRKNEGDCSVSSHQVVYGINTFPALCPFRVTHTSAAAFSLLKNGVK